LSNQSPLGHPPAKRTAGLFAIFPPWLRGLVRTMRLSQWTKNAFVFIPIFFDRQVADAGALTRVALAFALFCLTASAVYLLNDIIDIERDKLHPKKKFRAIPSGQLPLGIAKLAAVILPIFSIGSALLFSAPLALVLATYYGKDLVYSFYLKNVVILDVLAIAFGFILRVVAGVVVIAVTNFSPWLYIVVGMLSLFLAVGKRRQELILLADAAGDVRATYKQYNLPLLDDMLRLVTNATLMSYALYTIEARTNLGGQSMLLTVPIAVYGVFRYLYLIHVKGEGGAPDELLFKDKPLLLTAVVFVLAVGLIIYVLPKVLTA
jgi:4-hydroxybenzoate polyprenyltransferase